MNAIKPFTYIESFVRSHFTDVNIKVYETLIFPNFLIFSITEADDSKCGNVFQDLKNSDSLLASGDQTEGEKGLHVSRSVCARNLSMTQVLRD